MSRVVHDDFSCPVCASPSARWAAQYHGLRIVRCLDCGHGYVWPVPSVEFINSIYADNAYYHGGHESIGFNDYSSLAPARKKMFARHLAKIESHVEVGRILDVGCANGEFLNVARSRGWQVFGADPSAARSQAEADGIALVGATVHDAAIKRGSLDAITFWDVLEHVVDPISDLARARELLKPGGVLALTVPDSSNLVARTMGRSWFGYKTAGEHLQFFTHSSLRQALAKAGLTLRVQGPIRWSCTLGFLGDRAGLYLGKPGRMLGAVLSRPTLSSRVLDVPQINQFALGAPTRVTSKVAP